MKRARYRRKKDSKINSIIIDNFRSLYMKFTELRLDVEMIIIKEKYK